MPRLPPFTFRTTKKKTTPYTPPFTPPQKKKTHKQNLKCHAHFPLETSNNSSTFFFLQQNDGHKSDMFVPPEAAPVERPTAIGSKPSTSRKVGGLIAGLKGNQWVNKPLRSPYFFGWVR